MALTVELIVVVAGDLTIGCILLKTGTKKTRLTAGFSHMSQS